MIKRMRKNKLKKLNTWIILSFDRHSLFLLFDVVADVSDQLPEHVDPLGFGQVQAELLPLVHLPPGPPHVREHSLASSFPFAS